MRILSFDTKNLVPWSIINVYRYQTFLNFINTGNDTIIDTIMHIQILSQEKTANVRVKIADFNQSSQMLLANFVEIKNILRFKNEEFLCDRSTISTNKQQIRVITCVQHWYYRPLIQLVKHSKQIVYSDSSKNLIPVGKISITIYNV